jgi:hypothetical protein
MVEKCPNEARSRHSPRLPLKVSLKELGLAWSSVLQKKEAHMCQLVYGSKSRMAGGHGQRPPRRGSTRSSVARRDSAWARSDFQGRLGPP